MTTQNVATKLVELCRQGKNVDAINELYADKIVSIEPKGAHAELTEGKEAVLNKTQEFLNSVEVLHSAAVSDPIVTGDFFTCTMDMELTIKGMGKTSMNEVCVYEVKDGKIISEQFIYKINNN